MTSSEDLTPVDRPLMLSDLNDIRQCIHNIETVQLQWYEESKALVSRVAAIETRLDKRLWLPAFVSVVAAAVALLARVLP